MDESTKAVNIEIGGIPIAMSGCDDGFLEVLRQRYDGFVSSSRTGFEIRFDISSMKTVANENIRVTREGQEWLIKRADFDARWNPLMGRGRVRQDANPYSLDAVLRILHTLILAERGGFLLHAASAICEGHACLFSGMSGAGKTTIMRLAPDDVTLLTDEISYVKPATEGYSAFGTPFAGELAKSGENCSAVVSALFFLEQGPENRIEEMSSVEVVRRLMRNILFFAEDPELVKKLFTTACDFVSKVPIRRLTFYPDYRVWQAIRSFVRSFDEVPQHA